MIYHLFKIVILGLLFHQKQSPAQQITSALTVTLCVTSTLYLLQTLFVDATYVKVLKDPGMELGV